MRNTGQPLPFTEHLLTSPSPQEEGLIVLTSYIWKLRFREAECLVRGHTAQRRQDWDSVRTEWPGHRPMLRSGLVNDTATSRGTGPV